MNKSNQEIRDSYFLIREFLDKYGFLKTFKYAINEDFDYFKELFVDSPTSSSRTFFSSINGIEVNNKGWQYIKSIKASDGLQLYGSNLEELGIPIEEELEIEVSNFEGEHYHFIGKLKAKRRSDDNCFSYWFEVVKDLKREIENE